MQVSINTSSSSGDSASTITSKLEVLFEGQKLAVESTTYTSHVDPNHSGFNVDVDGPMSVVDMQSEVMASVATELGLMSELADGGLLLASTANLFPEPEIETSSGTQAANATSASATLSSGSLGQSGAGSSNSSTTNPVVGQGSSIGTSSFAGNSNGVNVKTPTSFAGPEPAPPAPVVTATVVTEPVEEPEQTDDKSAGTPKTDVTDESDSNTELTDDDDTIVETDEKPVVVALFEPSPVQSPGNSNNNGNSGSGNSSSSEVESDSGDSNSSATDENESPDVAPAPASGNSDNSNAGGNSKSESDNDNAVTTFT